MDVPHSVYPATCWRIFGFNIQMTTSPRPPGHEVQEVLPSSQVSPPFPRVPRLQGSLLPGSAPAGSMEPSPGLRAASPTPPRPLSTGSLGMWGRPTCPPCVCGSLGTWGRKSPRATTQCPVQPCSRTDSAGCSPGLPGCPCAHTHVKALSTEAQPHCWPRASVLPTVPSCHFWKALGFLRSSPPCSLQPPAWPLLSAQCPTATLAPLLILKPQERLRGFALAVPSARNTLPTDDFSFLTHNSTQHFMCVFLCTTF